MDSGYPTMAVEKTASPLTLRFAPKEIPWNTGPFYNEPRCYCGATLMVNVARSHPLTRGLPGFGGSGLSALGSMAVAIFLEGNATFILLGATNFKVLPIEVVNIFDILESFNLIEWFSKLQTLISINHMEEVTVIRKIIVGSSQGVQ